MKLKHLMVMGAVFSGSAFANEAPNRFSVTGFVGSLFSAELDDGNYGKADTSSQTSFGLGLDYLAYPTLSMGGYFASSTGDVNIMTTDTGGRDVEIDSKLTTTFLHARFRWWGYSSAYINTNAFLGGGVTHLNVDDGFGDDIHPSLHVGAGAVLPISENLAFRLDGAAFATFINSSGSDAFLDGSGVMWVDTSNTTIWQYNVNLGLEYSF